MTSTLICSSWVKVQTGMGHVEHLSSQTCDEVITGLFGPRGSQGSERDSDRKREREGLVFSRLLSSIQRVQVDWLESLYSLQLPLRAWEFYGYSNVTKKVLPTGSQYEEASLCRSLEPNQGLP